MARARSLHGRPPVDGRRALREVEALARLAKALGHPARIAILRVLARRRACVHGDIAGRFRLAPSTVAEHLRVLKEAGWIRGRVTGPNVSYCLDTCALEEMRRLLAPLQVACTRPSPESCT